MEQTFRPVLTIRIFGEEKCFGPGVAVLLRKVRELHSLRAAAMSIGMAYSKAWTILKNAQQSLGFKLLDLHNRRKTRRRCSADPGGRNPA